MFSFILLSCRTVLFGRFVHTEQVEAAVFLVTVSLMSINALVHSLEVGRFSARLRFLLSVCLSLLFLLCLCCHMHFMETLQRNICCLIEHFYTHSFMCFLCCASCLWPIKMAHLKEKCGSLKSGAGNGPYQL